MPSSPVLTRHQRYDLMQVCRSRQSATVGQAVSLGISGAILDAAADELVSVPTLASMLQNFEAHVGPERQMFDMPADVLNAWASQGSLLERHQRRAALSIASLPLVEMGLMSQNLASTLTLPPLSKLDARVWKGPRPLLPLELVAGRMACWVKRGPLPRASMFAVLEAGACTGELAGVRGSFFDSAEANSLALPGHAKVRGRTVSLIGWGRETNALYLSELFDQEPPDATRVFYGGRAVEPAKQQASMCGLIEKVLTLTGFGGDVNVKPHSIRSAGLMARLRGCTDEVTQVVLGMRQLGLSYDATAGLLGLA